MNNLKQRKNPQEEIKHLEENLAEYQKKYDELVRQSPDRWWHDEHFDNQLKVLDAIITDYKRRLVELKNQKARSG
jgi:hypothetical protein